MNVTKWTNLFALDVMGDFAFGKNFGVLQPGEAHHGLSLVHESMEPYGILTPIPWAFIIMAKLPFTTPFSRFVDWSNQQVREREKVCLPRQAIPLPGWY
jgi:tryprostatin B 6-hydroxylase